jgi:hypothetical protein
MTSLQMTILGIVCASGIFFMACRTKKYAFQDRPATSIAIGNGGGFAGTEHRYILIESGQVFAGKSGSANFTELKSISSSTAQQFLKTARENLLGNVTLNELGNTYMYMEYIDGKETRRIAWSGQVKMNPALSNIYDTLTKHVTKYNK